MPGAAIVIDCALPLSAAIDDLLPAMRRGDLAGFQQIFSRLHHDGMGLPPDQLTAAVGELAPVLARRPEGVFARLALTAGALVEWGGSALPLAANAPACALLTMVLRSRFSELWPAASGGRPEPGLEQPPSMAELIGVFAGRTYEHMAPALTLDYVMTPDQAAPWRARIAPARETDLFGRTSQT